MVDEIYNEMAAAKMGIEEKGQVRGTSHLMSSDLMTSPPPPHTHTHTHTGMHHDPQWVQGARTPGGHRSVGVM